MDPEGKFATFARKLLKNWRIGCWLKNKPVLQVGLDANTYYQAQAHKRIALFTEKAFKVQMYENMYECIIWHEFTFCFCVARNVMLDNHIYRLFLSHAV